MFSVVIPLFNKAPHIAATINSVLAQTLPPDEIIIVDDGSTDESAVIASSFAGQKVVVIRQANQGVSAARNTGAAAARSSHIAFLDADDTWLPQHLKTLQSLILQFPAAQLFSTLYEIHLGRDVFWPKPAYPYGFVGLVDDFLRRMAVGLSLVSSTTACVSRQAFLEVGGFPAGIKRGEDIVFWIKLSQKYNVAHSAAITAIYNRNAINRSTSLREPTAPGSLLYLQNLIASSRACRKSSARLLFRKVAFYTAAGMRETGDLEGFDIVARLAQKNNFILLALKIRLLGFVPPAFLSLARRYRHKSHNRSPRGAVTSV